MQLQQSPAYHPDAQSRHAPTEGHDPDVAHRFARHDTASEQTVEIGIRLQEILGTGDAAKFLQHNAISIDVALRVLLQPSRCRKNDAGTEVSVTCQDDLRARTAGLSHLSDKYT